ncbi:PIG-L deacetylase family protein [Silvibacterium sp.]|uniref:PIG-L deacetylase family protein n=1 Tax=Silvibacterium sp. TaxID=1964179 RepID=UPI0039E6EEF2
MSYRLLCITAHPDDESGAFGGALLTAHREGAETHIICLTDGQAAHYRGNAADGAELGRLRRAELEAASDMLGVTSLEILHYPDGELLRVDMYELIGVLVERTRKLKPHVVLTFGGDGNVNLHRDHTVVSMATTAAFHWAARALYFPEQQGRGLTPWTAQKLYYLSTPFISVRDCPELASMPTVPWSLTLDLGELSERKTEAFALHSTQAGVLERVRDFLEPHKATERYLLVAARGGIAAHEDTGLFAGVIVD